MIRRVFLLIVALLLLADDAHTVEPKITDEFVMKKLQAYWSEQARTGAPYSYPILMWHGELKQSQIGWVATGKLYEKLKNGYFTHRTATLLITRRHSDTQALAVVKMVRHFSPRIGFGGPSTSRRWVFLNGFDLSRTAEGQEFEFEGGVVVHGTHTFVSTTNTRNTVPAVMPVKFPPLPSNDSE